MQLPRTSHLMTKHHQLVDPSWIPPETTHKHPFTPDNFQLQAFHLISTNQNILVTAHTSSGKTAVAEHAIHHAIQNNNKAIYTSPIKALSNQKYYDFKHKFDDVGILTGDIQINSEAQCLIMTTEILRNRLFKNTFDSAISVVIFDEVHYVNDRERGVVWEECLILLPSHVTLVMLSATVANGCEFAEWVGRVKKRMVHVIVTEKRAVPLEYLIFGDDKIYGIDGEFLVARNSDEMRKKYYSQKKDTSKAVNKSISGKKSFSNASVNRFYEFQNYFKKAGNKISVYKLANYVVEAKITPSIFFCFSISRCEKYAHQLLSLDLTTEDEKRSIKEILFPCLLVLGDVNQNLPQVQFVRTLLLRGIGVHFSSLLHVLREATEILLGRGLLKILVATETFAMGVNTPTRSCVFLGITKIDSDIFRPLQAGEFTQMSGRAGRRGKDEIGTIIFATHEIMKENVLKSLLGKHVTPLRSQFHLSFASILSTLRSAIPVENLIRKSFREDEVQKNLDSYIQKIDYLNKKHLKLCQFECCLCKESIDEYFELIKDVCENNCKLLKKCIKKDELLILKNNKIVSVVNFNNHCIDVKEEFVENVHKFRIQDGVDNVTKNIIDKCKNGVENVKVVVEPGEIKENSVSNKKLEESFKGLNIDATEIMINEENITMDKSMNNSVADINKTLVYNNSMEDTKIDDCSNIDFKEIETSGFNFDDGKCFSKSKYLKYPISVVCVGANKSNLVETRDNLLYLEDMNQDAFIKDSLNNIKHAISFEDVFGIFPCLVKDYKIESICDYIMNKKLCGVVEKLKTLQCNKCNQFIEHYTEYKKIKDVEEELKKYKSMIDDKNLGTIEEYISKYNFMVDNDYVENKTLLLKGKVAVEIRTVDSILLTELILNNELKKFSGDEILCAFSTLLFKDKMEEAEPQKNELYEILDEYRKEINSKFNVHGIESIKESNRNAIVPMELWLNGGTLVDVALLGISEGSFVKLILRLDEFCREVLVACEVIGDFELKDKIIKSAEKLKREDLFLMSLYV